MKQAIIGILACLDSAASEIDYHQKVAKLAEALGRYLAARDSQLLFPVLFPVEEPQRYVPTIDFEQEIDRVTVDTAEGKTLDLIPDANGPL